jgi:DNA-binding winged helix-turn-helix (wHTH) protein/hemoglobin-like flavoprotein
VPADQRFHVCIGELELDEQEREVRRAGRRLAIQPKVFDVLVYLVHARDRVVPRDELLRAIWPDTTVGPDSITRALREIRRLFGDATEVLRTYPGRGVRFVGTLAPARIAVGAALSAAPTLIGRDDAVAACDAALARLATGRGGLRVVLGAPGTGKTAMLALAEQRARANGIAVHRASSAELASAVAAAAAGGAAVVTCDDASGVSSDAIDALATSVERAPVLVLVTCCTSTRRTPTTIALLAAAARAEPGAVLALAPLDRAALGELAQRTLGAQGSPVGVAKLHALVGGHPRFALHVLHLAKETGRSLETLAPLPASFADRLRELVLAHTAVLGPRARALVEDLAVLDEEFPLAVAPEVAALGASEAADAVAEAAEAGLLVEVAPGRWRFAHEVVRAVLERDLAPSRRARAHAGAAAALEHALGAPPAQLERIARHYVAGASVAHAEHALAMVRRVAELALDASAFGKAAHWLGLALDVEAHLVPPSHDRRRALRVELAKVLARDGEVERAAEVFGAARALEGSEIRAAFDAIAPRLPQIIDRFYELLFARHPELRAMFTRPASLQRRMFGETIAALAEHTDDPGWLDEHLARLGRTHVEYGVTDEMYAWARAAFLDAIETVRAPRRLPPGVRETWARAYDTLADKMRAVATVTPPLAPYEPPQASAR